MKRVVPSADGLRMAADALAGGEVVAYPTETVYGLGVDPFSPQALVQLFTVKQRPSHHPVLVIVAHEDQLTGLVAGVGPRAKACMESFWPGPLSLVLPASSGLPEPIAPGGKICVRCPSCDTARALCDAFGGPITSTSANISGQQPARTLDAAALPGVAIGIDGGELTSGVPSTVYDPDVDQILREGAVSISDLARLFG